MQTTTSHLLSHGLVLFETFGDVLKVPIEPSAVIAIFEKPHQRHTLIALDVMCDLEEKKVWNRVNGDVQKKRRLFKIKIQVYCICKVD